MSKDERQMARLYVPTGIITKPIFSANAEQDSNLTLAKQTLWRQNQEEEERNALWRDANETGNHRDDPPLPTTDQESTSPEVSIETLPMTTTAPEQSSTFLSSENNGAVPIQQSLSAESSPRSLPTSSSGTTSFPKFNAKNQYETKAFAISLSPTTMAGGNAVRGDRVGLTDAALEDIAASVRDLGARLQAEVGAVSKLQGQAPLQTAAINSLRHQQERDRQWVARVEQATGGLAQRVDDLAALLHALEARVSQLDSVWSTRCVALERAVALQGAQLDEQAGVLARVASDVGALARERQASLRLAEAVGALQMEFATERRTVSCLRDSVVAMGALWTAPLRCQFCTGCSLSLNARNTRMQGTLQLQLEDPTGVLTSAAGLSHRSPRRSAHAYAQSAAASASSHAHATSGIGTGTGTGTGTGAVEATEATRRTHAFTFGMVRGSDADTGALAPARRAEGRAFADSTDQFSAWLATIDATIPDIPDTQPTALRAAPSAAPAVPVVRDTQPPPAEPLAPLVVVKPVEHCVLCDLPHCADCALLAHATLKLKSTTRYSARGSPRAAHTHTPGHVARASCGSAGPQGSAPPFRSALTPATHAGGASGTQPDTALSAALTHLHFADPFLRARDGLPLPGSGQGPGYGPVPLSVTVTAAFAGAATGSMAPTAPLPATAACTAASADHTRTYARPTAVLPAQALTLTLASASTSASTSACASGSSAQAAATDADVNAPVYAQQPPLERSNCSGAHRNARLKGLAGGNEAGQHAALCPPRSRSPDHDCRDSRAGVASESVRLQCLPASMHPLLPLWYYTPPYPHSWAGELWRHVHVLVKHHHARLEAVQRARLRAVKTKLEAWAKAVDTRVAALARELRPLAHTHERMASRHHALLEALRGVHAQVMDVRKFELSVSGAVAEELRQLARTLTSTLEAQQPTAARPVGGVTRSHPRAVGTLATDAHATSSRYHAQGLHQREHGAASPRDECEADPRVKGPARSPGPGAASEDLRATLASLQPASQSRTPEAATTLLPGTPPLSTSVGRMYTSSTTPRSRRAEGHGRLMMSQLDAAAQRLAAVQTQLVDNELLLRTLSTPEVTTVNEYQPLLSNTADTATAAVRAAFSQPSTIRQLPSLQRRKRAPLNEPLIN